MAFRSSSILPAADGLAAVAVPVPAGAAAGDVVVVGIYKENTAAVTGPDATWTEAAALTTSASARGALHVWWKRLTAADTGTYTFSWSGPSFAEAVAGAWSGRAATGDPFDGAPGTAESTAHVTSLPVSATPAAAGGDAVGVWINFNGGVEFTPPANYTERQDGDVTTLDTRDAVAAGSTGSISATVLAAQSNFMKGFLGVLAAQPASTDVTGTLAGTLPALTGSLTGVIPEDVTGTVTGTLPALTGSLTGTSDAPPHPFVTGISGLHFVDQDGQPILVKGDTVWAFPVNAGRRNGGDWQADIDAYMAARGSQGYNAVYMALLGSVQNNGPSDTGANENGDLPFVGGDPATFNEAYWQRVDYILSSAEAQGITVFCDYAYSNDLNNAALSGKTDAEFTSYGTSLGTRYAARPNLVWTIGGDYFGTWDDQLALVLSAIRAAGDTHVIAAENNAETTSRFAPATGAVEGWGTAHAQWNFCYTYNVTYDVVEYAMGEASPLPVLWGDGHYDQGTTADRHLMRNLTWWAYTSGSRGAIYGSESIWNWDSGSLTAVTSPGVFSGTDLPTIRDTFASYTGWHELLPDTDSSFVTAGRGAHAAHLASGGGGGEYNSTSPQDPYVTASVTPDGMLAMAYLPVATTITVNDTELAAGYTVAWVDPVTGTATLATPATTYTSPGANSVGDADWLLVFTAPTDVTGTVAGTLPALTGAATATVTVRGTVDGDVGQVGGGLQAEATVTGGVAGALPGLTGGLAGDVTSGITGAVTGVLPALTGALSGDATVTGAATGVLPALGGAVSGFVGDQQPAVDFTVTVNPARIRGRATPGGSRSGWATGDNRASVDAADSRERQRATTGPSHIIERATAAGTRPSWQAGDNRTSIQVGPSRDDRKD